MSITLKNITKTYGTQKALNNVSLEIPQGQIVGLLGPNGAGKSTMMKIITCFLPPTEGTAEVCGFDIFDHPVEVRRRIGYLPEHNPLYVDMYVKEFLNFVAGIHNIYGSKRKARIDEIIALTGLTKEYKKKISALSKGYRQRVGLAQALIHDPEVLILDEPTGGLDPNQLIEIRRLISSVGKTKTVLLSTHIMQEVEAICQRTIIINDGKIVADDSLSELSQHESADWRFVIEFDKPIDENVLKKTIFLQHLHKVSPSTYVITTKGRDIRSELFTVAVARNWTILTIRKEEKSLEEIFRDLTQKHA